MGDIVTLHNKTTLDIPVSRVLENFPQDAKSLVVIGETADGELYFASSIGKFSSTMWLLQLAQRQLLECGGPIA